MLKNTCCSICLSINNRTINIYDTDLRYVYETLANFKISDNECWMCYICHTRLRQCHQLQQLAVQTRGLIDDIFQNKVDIKYRAYGSLLKLSNSKTKIMCTTQHIKQESDGVTEFYYDNNVQLNEYVELKKTKKNISTTPNCSYIEQDVKREVCSDNEVEQDEIVKNEEETFAMAPEDPILGEQESNVESDAQKVLKLKLNELSQSVIDKCFGQSPSTHPVTEIYIEDTGNRAWGEQSNAEVKLEIETEDKGIHQDAEQNARDCSREDLKNCLRKGPKGKPRPRRTKKPKKTFVCDICSKEFAHKGRLQNHILGHSGNRIAFSCDVCSKSFSQRSDLNSHMSIHTGEQPYSCDICFKKFTKTSNFKQHQLIHTGERPFGCDICSKRFTTKSNLKHHKLIHTGKTQLRCENCKKKFAQKSNFNNHIMLCHSDNKPFSSDICSKRFAKTSNFQQHQLIHTGERPFCCHICSKKFTTKSNLKNHQLIHTGKTQFSCNICSKKFIQKSHLNSHVMLNHTDNRRFSCDICSNYFMTKGHLKQHQLIHSVEQSFCCDICSKKFTTKSNLKNHKLTHAGEKPFSCDICSKKFTQKSHLHSHMPTHADSQAIKSEIV